jgi:hypothetical protein
MIICLTVNGDRFEICPPGYSGDHSRRCHLLSIMYDYNNLALSPERGLFMSPAILPDENAIY